MAAAAIVGSLLFASPSWAIAVTCSSGNLCFDVATLAQSVSDIAVLQEFSNAYGGDGGFSVSGPSTIVDPTSYTSQTGPSLVFLMGHIGSTDLVLFTNTTFNGTDNFSTLFPNSNENTLISDLEAFSAGPSNGDFNTASNDLLQFTANYIDPTLGFNPSGGTFTIFEYTDGSNIGDGTSSFTPLVAATPLPPTWTMMLLGLAGLGLFAYRRRSIVASTAL